MQEKFCSRAKGRTRPLSLAVENIRQRFNFVSHEDGKEWENGGEGSEVGTRVGYDPLETTRFAGKAERA